MPELDLENARQWVGMGLFVALVLLPLIWVTADLLRGGNDRS